MVMLYEYFALIFVRARSSIVFFSRTAALSFVAFHVYFYHFQMGFFGLAAWSSFLGMFSVKLYVLQAIELPAYTSGEVSQDAPRAHFVELPCESPPRGRRRPRGMETCRRFFVVLGLLSTWCPSALRTKMQKALFFVRLRNEDGMHLRVSCLEASSSSG